MAAPDRSKMKVHILPPPPKGFDPFAATKEDLEQYGLPRRPDPFREPGLAVLWDRQARRYQVFEHLTPSIQDSPTAQLQRLLGISPSDPQACGYTLTSVSEPFTALFIHWTVPHLVYVAPPVDVNNLFHTFVGLGNLALGLTLDVHVEMTVDSAQHVTSVVWCNGVGQTNLPVAPGDTLSASLCLDPKPPQTGHYFLANETTGQTINFRIDTGFPPAVSIFAGVARDLFQNNPTLSPLARFGVVYFDEILAYSTGGSQLLTDGQAITMTDFDGSPTLASPVQLNDYAFKAVHK